MPQKNSLKHYQSNTYYHVFARGVNKRKIFIDEEDYEYFIFLFERYLGRQSNMPKSAKLYPNFSTNLELVSYCLMPNHFHIFVYQIDIEDGLPKFMASLLTSYSKYFNKKYKRVGTLFESRYKAKTIDSDSYLLHISRYIHLNPRYWRRYKHSSLRYIYSDACPSWLRSEIIRQSFNKEEEYIVFLENYISNKKDLEIVKKYLADW